MYIASVTNVKLIKDRVAGLPDGIIHHESFKNLYIGKSIGYGFVEF